MMVHGKERVLFGNEFRWHRRKLTSVLLERSIRAEFFIFKFKERQGNRHDTRDPLQNLS